MNPGTSSSTSEELRAACENFIIGDHPCTLVAVCETIGGSNASGTLWSKLEEIAKILEYPEDRAIMIRTSIALGTKTHYSVLHEVLQSWRGIKSKQAKLHTLIKVLERKRLQSCADALRYQFCMCQTSRSTSAENLLNCQSEDLTSTEGLLPSFPAPVPYIQPREIRRNMIIKKRCIQFFPILLVVMFVIGITVMCIVLEIPRNSDPDQNTVNVTVAVKSFQEYESKMKKLPSNYRVNLCITASDENDWGTDFTLTNIEKVSNISISGFVPLKAIFDILDQVAPNLKGLTITDAPGNDSSICKYTNGQSIPLNDNKIRLWSLLELNLLCATCTNIFNVFVKRASFLDLASFPLEMENIKMNIISEAVIDTVTQGSSSTLKTLRVIGINDVADFWVHGYQNMFSFSRLSYLLLQPFNGSSTTCGVNDCDKYNKQVLSHNFGSVEKLELTGFQLPQSVFEDTFPSMKSLVELSVAIGIEEAEFDFNSIPNQISKLDLYLDFENCTTSGQIPQLLNRNSSTGDTMKSVQIGTNCPSLRIQPPLNLKI